MLLRVPINPLAGQKARQRAKDRCEWHYADRERCINTMKVQLHHRTYIREGVERSTDLSVLCSSHHLLADAVRRFSVGVRDDIISQTFQKHAYEKWRYAPPKNQPKFIARLQRETLEFHRCSQESIRLICQFERYDPQQVARVLKEEQAEILLWRYNVLTLATDRLQEAERYYPILESYYWLPEREAA